MGRGPNKDRETIAKAKGGGLILKGKGEKAPPKCAKSYTLSANTPPDLLLKGSFSPTPGSVHQIRM